MAKERAQKRESNFKYVLGLDLGIASIGWAILNLDRKRIEDLGVRTFSESEDRRGKPKNLIRRNSRLSRRTIRRKKGRLKAVRELFVKEGLIPKDNIISTFESSSGKKDVWDLRKEGLYRKLTNEEWARVLFHICKRRGFKSNRKSNQDNEVGKMKKAIAENVELLSNYKTTGEMFASDPKFREKKKNGEDSYKATITRDLLEKEVKVLFEKQAVFNNPYTNEDFKQAYLEIFNYQKEPPCFDEVYDMVGNCTLEPEEKRAARSCYTAELFQLLTQINHLRLLDEAGNKIVLTKEQRNKIKELAFKIKTVKYNRIRKELNLNSDILFANLNYKKEKVENNKFIELTGYHTIKSNLKKIKGKKTILEDTDLLDDVITVLTLSQTEEDTFKQLSKRNINKEIIQALKDVSFSGTKHLSIKAIKNLIPYLEKGYNYNEAVIAAGYSDNTSNDKKSYKLPTPEELNIRDRINNPTVLRTLAQTRKVINNIIEKYGSPYFINIEVARELKNSKKRLEEINRIQNKNKKSNEEAREFIQNTYGILPSKNDIIKWRLWKEQNERCMYSLKPIPADKLFKPGHTQIDHIIPFSRTFDDSYNNKVLVLTDANQDKKNRIPYEYFNKSLYAKITWEEFENFVHILKLHGKKKENLLRKKFTKEDEKKFKQRNLNDTKYISKEISKIIKENLLFAKGEEKQRVRMVNGKVTSILRRQWGLFKDRDNGYLHHALDAAVIATVSQGLIQKMNIDSKYEKESKFEEIWPNFREELIARLSLRPSEEFKKLNLQSYSDVDFSEIEPIIVSKSPSKKVTGSFHKDTIYSAKYYNPLKEGHYIVEKIPLEEIAIEQLEYIFSLEGQSIYNTLIKPNLDIYKNIYNKLQEHNGKAKTAFEKMEDRILRKNAPPVKKIKIVRSKTIKGALKVREGLALKPSMIRVDIFIKDDKYYGVPIYPIDIAKKSYPKKALHGTKWYELNTNFKFIFSLFKDELVEVKDKKGLYIGYYQSFHSSNGNLEIEPLISLGYYSNLTGKSETYGKDKINKSISTLINIKKYHVTLLGAKYEVKREKFPHGLA